MAITLLGRTRRRRRKSKGGLGAPRRKKRAARKGVRCKAKYGWKKNASGTKCIRAKRKKR